MYPARRDRATIFVRFCSVDRPENCGAQFGFLTEIAHDLSEVGPSGPFSICLYCEWTVFSTLAPIDHLLIRIRGILAGCCHLALLPQRETAVHRTFSSIKSLRLFVY